MQRRRPTNEENSQRRRYDSPLRRQRAAETRQRIITAGSELLHHVPIWNWRELTIRAVAKRAGVNERTVYRYFPSERDLRNAVLHRLEQEADVELDGMRLEDIASVTRKILTYTSSFPLAPRQVRDPTVAAANRRQRDALLDAVAPHTERWAPADRVVAAGMFDVLWSVVNYERLVTDWELKPEEAIGGITWIVELVEEAVREGRHPSGTPTP